MSKRNTENLDTIDDLQHRLADCAADGIVQNFEQTLSDATSIIFTQLNRITLQGAGFLLLINGLESKVGINCCRTQAEQYGELVRIPG